MNPLSPTLRTVLSSVRRAAARRCLVPCLFAGLAASSLHAAGPPVVFLPLQSVPAPDPTCSVKLADMNGDGKLDAIVGTYSGAFLIYLGNGDGTFQPPTRYVISTNTSNGPGLDVVVADFNRDGKLDVATHALNDGKLFVFLGNGDGTLQAPTVYATGTRPGFPVVGDFNRDGNLDIAITNQGSGTIQIFAGNGAGAFPSSRLLAAGSSPAALVALDFNGDGQMDLGWTSADGPSGHAWNTLPDTVNLTGRIQIQLVDLPSGAAAGRLNPAALPAVAIPMPFQNRVAVYPAPLTSGNGASYATYGKTPTTAVMADLNQDGFLDVVVANQNENFSNINVFLGNGDGTLASLAATAAGFKPNSLAVGDLNGDGFPDVVVTDGTSRLVVLIQAAPSLVVTTTADENDGNSIPTSGTGASLRECLAYAQSLPGSRTITFSPAVFSAPATLTVNSPLAITGNVTIQGPAAGVTISGMDAVRVFDVQSGGGLTLRDLTVAGGRTSGGAPPGGGAGLRVEAGGSATVDGCTFTGNSGGSGGAIRVEDSASLLVKNSTFTGNTATSGPGGGAIYSQGSVILDSCTVAGNSSGSVAGGLVSLGGASLAMTNTLLANNSGGDVSITSAASGSNNLIRTGSYSGLTNTVTGDPLLASLASNGGPTQTMLLTTGSPAINAGVFLAPTTVDQRGIPRAQGSAFDIGAVEVRQVTPVLTRNSLSNEATDAPYSLLTATGPTPTGGTFSGNGVSGGIFYPGQAAGGYNALTYAVASVDQIVASVSISAYVDPAALAPWRALQGLASDGSQDFANPSGDGVSNLAKYAFNLAPNGGDLNKPNATTLTVNGTSGLPAISRDVNGRLVIDFVRRKAETLPGVAYVVQTSADLVTWQTLSLSGATVTSIDSIWERVSVTEPTVAAQCFGRVLLAEAAPLYNFALGYPLQNNAAFSGGAVALTNGQPGQNGQVYFNGVTVGAATKGFTASFFLAFATDAGGNLADGMSFAVGNLGTGAYGEKGPLTSHSLAIGFDTYENLEANNVGSRGLHVWVNGVQVAYSTVDPYNSGFGNSATVDFDPVSGLSLTFNGVAIVTNLPVSGFTLQPGDQFGMGARTGGFAEYAYAGTILIAPR